MVESESSPKCMWLPLNEFTDYSEMVFSIDNHWVFSWWLLSYKGNVSEVWEAMFALFFRMGVNSTS